MVSIGYKFLFSVQWGLNLSIRLSVHPFVRLPRPPADSLPYNNIFFRHERQITRIRDDKMGKRGKGETEKMKTMTARLCH